jgi:hypothetical protein
MGADTFTQIGKGKTAEDAFRKCKEDAAYECGHSGYTGTIAEKDSFIMIELPEGRKIEEYANSLIEACDERVDDKWGPAGCIKIAEGEWYFFGLASS